MEKLQEGGDLEGTGSLQKLFEGIKSWNRLLKGMSSLEKLLERKTARYVESASGEK